LMAVEAAHQLNERGARVEMVLLLDSKARYPTPHKVAWEKLKKEWGLTRHLFDTDCVSTFQGVPIPAAVGACKRAETTVGPLQTVGARRHGRAHFAMRRNGCATALGFGEANLL
jgi:hypothetical protein